MLIVECRLLIEKDLVDNPSSMLSQYRSAAELQIGSAVGLSRQP
jgi:hypothetical protein